MEQFKSYFKKMFLKEVILNEFVHVGVDLHKLIKQIVVRK